MPESICRTGVSTASQAHGDYIDVPGQTLGQALLFQELSVQPRRTREPSLGEKQSPFVTQISVGLGHELHEMRLRLYSPESRQQLVNLAAGSHGSRPFASVLSG